MYHLCNQVGFSQKEGSPIIHARVSGNFAFVECRSIEETTALLNLNNIPFLGQVCAPAPVPPCLGSF